MDFDCRAGNALRWHFSAVSVPAGILVGVPCSLSDLAVLDPAFLAAHSLSVPDSLAAASVPLWRSKPSSKYHWADSRGWCQHVPRAEGRVRSRGVPSASEQLPALGFSINEHDVCRQCARQISISPTADLFVKVAAELSRCGLWIVEGEKAMNDRTWTWRDFAEWRARQPLRGPTWVAVSKSIKGAQWKQPAADLAARIEAGQKRSSATVKRLAASIQGDAGQAALLERAIAMVFSESAAQREADQIAAYSMCPGLPDPDCWFAQQPPRPKGCYPKAQIHPWALVSGAWKLDHENGRVIDPEVYCTYLDKIYPHVHDLEALTCSSDVQPGSGCLHEWAIRMARHQRRNVIAEWVSRLEMAWDGLRASSTDSSDACTHLLMVQGWPLTGRADESLAYLTQFDVCLGPFTFRVDRYGYQEDDHWAVLLVPEWAAVHVSEGFSGKSRSELSDGSRLQAVAMARQLGVPITTEEFKPRRKPSKLVAEARAKRDRDTDRGWFRRPLAQGAQPPRTWDTEWTRNSAGWALLQHGNGFVYDYDQISLLALGLPELENGGYYTSPASVNVELQTGCIDHMDAGVHLCNVPGRIVGVAKDGAMTFRPDHLRNRVTIPAAYLVDVRIHG